MKTYLFYLTFGPIQSFIEQSRKTRDLHAASQILSQLAKAAITEVVKEQKGTLIIPQDSDSLPNYLLAKFSAEPNQVGKAVKNALCNKFEEIARQARKRTGERKPADFDEQIKEHLDIHWAFVEVQPDYDSAYKNLQSIVAGLKNTRIFSQIKGGTGECGRKCSLDGERNALFYHKNSDEQKPPYILNDAVEINNSKLRPNEGLSAVSLVKRCYDSLNREIDFPSTADIALMKYLEEIKSTQDGKDLIDFLQKTFVKEDDYNQLYYQENLTERYFDKNGLSSKKSFIPKIKEKLEKLGSFKKTKYYALLKYDGDKMGEHLSGANLPSDNIRLREFHQELSKKLAEFAKHAREEILIPPHGKTVYAGGDDFLGFVNLHSVFPKAEKLRIEFNERVSKPMEKEFKLEKPLTFSAGIVIAHYKTPLHIVLRNATDLLKTIAKKKLDRDAFAIRLLKHSGESHECGFKWNLTEPPRPLDDLQCIVEQLRENFSINFIQVLNQEMRLLHQETVTTQVIEGEMTRLVKRSAQKDDLDKEKVDLIEALKSLNNRSDATDMGVENFLETLNVCKFMHREIG